MSDKIAGAAHPIVSFFVAVAGNRCWPLYANLSRHRRNVVSHRAIAMELDLCACDYE
jgi:hypothetical protein